MPVKIVHQWPSCQGTAPAPPSAARAALLGENASNSPCAENAARGSSSRLTTYAAMQAAVTTLVKLLRPNSARSGAAKPHIPGLRRPQTRHWAASALVRRPHEGQRMVPVVLRNIVFALRLRDAIAFVEPDAQIDQTAGERHATRRCRHVGQVTSCLRGVAPTSPQRTSGRIVPAADKPCQLNDFRVDTLGWLA